MVKMLVRAMDKVVISKDAKDYEDGPGLTDSMKLSLGKKAMVMKVMDRGRTALLDIDNGWHAWDVRWLKKVEK
jgi:hypothetical protein